MQLPDEKVHVVDNYRLLLSHYPHPSVYHWEEGEKKKENLSGTYQAGTKLTTPIAKSVSKLPTEASVFIPRSIHKIQRLCLSIEISIFSKSTCPRREKTTGSIPRGWREGEHTVFDHVVHLRRLHHLRLTGPAVTYDVLPRLRVGEDELVRPDPDHLAVPAVQLEDVKGEPARHEPVAVADARSTHPERAGELPQWVEEDIVADVAHEVAGELGRAGRVSCGGHSGTPWRRPGGPAGAGVWLTEREAITSRLPRLKLGVLIPMTAMGASLCSTGAWC